MKTQVGTDLGTSLIDAMAKKAFIEDNKNDVEAYFRIPSDSEYMVLSPYLTKYNYLLDLINSQAQSQ